MTLIYLSASWLVGTYLASLIRVSVLAWLAASLLPLAIAVLWRRNTRVRLASLCLLFCLLGGVRYVLAEPRRGPDSVSLYNDSGPVTLVGVVVAEPDVRDTHMNLRVRAETVARSDGALRRVNGLVLVRAPRYPERFYGDRLEIVGELRTPPVLGEFDFASTCTAWCSGRESGGWREIRPIGPTAGCWRSSGGCSVLWQTWCPSRELRS